MQKESHHAVMPAEAVLNFLRLMKGFHIEVVLDGGWAVDALLGEQTRAHQDLDIVVFHEDVPAIRRVLENRGFREIPLNDSWECNFVYGNDQGHQIDIHSCTFDENNRNIFGVEYPWESLQGKGAINGYPVRCVPPEWLIDFHTGYPLDDNDYHDVKLLCGKFDLPVPSDYDSFLNEDNI